MHALFLLFVHVVAVINSPSLLIWTTCNTCLILVLIVYIIITIHTLTNCDRILENQPLYHIWSLNISTSDKALHSTNQHCSRHRIILYHELPEILWSILIAACVLLWLQPKVIGSIYFRRDKVIDFPKPDHNYCNALTYLLLATGTVS